MYILFVDPENYIPQISWLSLTDIPTQNMLDIKLALFQTFQNIDLPVHKDKMVFLVSHDASVNSRVKAGLATKFLEWLTRMDGFVWCLFHCLELSLKESLDGKLEPVKKSLIRWSYLYHKPTKTLRQLCKLQSVLKDIYNIEENWFRSARVTFCKVCLV